MGKMKTFINRLRNISLVFMLLVWQVVFAGAPLLQSGVAHAATLSSNDVAISSKAFGIDHNSSYSVVNGQPTGAGSISNGNVGVYPEGACIPVLFDVKNTSNSAGDTTVSPVFDYYDNGVVGIERYELVTYSGSGNPETSVTNLNQLTFSGHALSDYPTTTFKTTGGATVNATIGGPFSGDSAGTTALGTTDQFGHYNIALSNIPAGATVQILTCGRLGLDASQYPGSSLSFRTYQGGQENLAIPVNQILVLPSITVTKTVASGTALPSDFSFVISPNPNNGDGTSYTIPSGQNTVTIPNVNPDGTYTITESGPAGYTFTSGTGTGCSVVQSTVGTAAGQMSATVAAGKPATNATCNFTNSILPSTLTVVKDVVNNNGGTMTAGNFPVKVNGTQLTGGVLSNGNLTDTYAYSNPQANTSYTVSEDSPTASGYTQASLTCTDNNTHSAVANPVVLNAGQNVTCVITNDDIAPSLTLNKIVSNTHGGTAVESNWTLTATGPTTLSGPGAAGSADVVSGSTFSAGTYTLSESGGPGGYSASDWTCTNNVTVSNNQITLANGQTTVCSITNSDIAPILTVVKNVVNPYGTPLDPTAFPLFVDDLSVTTGVPTTQFNAGTHTVTETQQTGYTLTGVSGDCTLNSGTISLTLSIGGSSTCTLTNTAIQPKLIVIKHVVNDNGGTKSASDFTMTVSGNSATVPNFPGNEAGVTVPLNEGSYSADELAAAGYSKSLSADCSGTISIGQTKTCTITNDDIAPSLTLNKIVSNTHGGTAVESNWTLTATGPSTLSGPGAAGSADVVSGSSFKAGTYTLSESGGPGGYSASAWTCTNNVTVTNSQITLANSQTTVCSITNSDVAPILTVTKVVVNPYGVALDPSAFPLFVDGVSVTTGVPTTQFSAGSHTVTETQQSGYTLTGVSGDCTQNQQGTIGLTLSIGGSSTCTLTNTAIQPKLTVIKHVINDNSGTESASDFTMTVSGNPATVPNFPGSESGTTVGLDEGSYTVGETSHDGYTETFSGDCSGTIAIGQTKTCTVTNNDIAHPAIHIVKSGPATAHEGDTVTYTFTVTNTGDTSLSGVTVNDDIAGAGVYQSGDTNNDGILQTTETWIYAKDYLIPAGQIADVVNTAEACGDYSDTTVCDTDNHTLDVLHPSISVVKSGPATAFEGDTVTYHFLVTNTGDTELFNVGVADDIATGETCLSNTLDVGESTTCTATYAIPTPQIANVTNHVVASGTDSLDETVTATDQHTLDVLHPSIHVVKTGPASAAAGSTVTYTFTVTNTGDVPLSNLTVQDNIAGAGVYQSGDTNNNQMLDLNETWIYTAQYTIPANQFNSVVNTVTACGVLNREFQDELNIDSIDGGTNVTACAQASHTLVIPKVLAAQLVNTGQSAQAGIFAGLALLGLLGATTYFTRQNKKQI